jgi:hypothetical protein
VALTCFLPAKVSCFKDKEQCLTSGELQGRFSTQQTHNNAECGPQKTGMRATEAMKAWLFMLNSLFFIALPPSSLLSWREI